MLKPLSDQHRIAKTINQRPPQSSITPGRENRQVLYIWPYLEWAGAQIYFMSIMKLAKEHYHVRAIMPAGSDSKILGYMQRIGVNCEFFSAHLDTSPARTVWEKVKRRLRNAYCSLVIVQYLSHKPLKHVILHLDMAPWSSFWLLSYLSLRSNVNVTLHSAVPRLPWLRRLEWQFKFRILSFIPGFRLLVSNRDMLKSLKSYLSDRYLSSVPIAYTGVDTNEIRQALEARPDRDWLYKKHDLPAGRFLVFSVGQIIPRKGCLVLINAIKKLHAFRPPLFFVWIGDGAQRNEIERSIEQDGLHDSFKIIKPADIGPARLDLLELIQLADVFVHPSFYEGLPGAILEAMALGKACVASRVNGIPEAIQDRETGLLIPAGDSAALAAAITELVRDSALRERLARNGQAYVNKHFDERIAAQITVRHYDACRQGL